MKKKEAIRQLKSRVDHWDDQCSGITGQMADTHHADYSFQDMKDIRSSWREHGRELENRIRELETSDSSEVSSGYLLPEAIAHMAPSQTILVCLNCGYEIIADQSKACSWCGRTCDASREEYRQEQQRLDYLTTLTPAVCLNILKEGVTAWKAWRTQYHPRSVNLQGLDLRPFSLRGVDLSSCDLTEAKLSGLDMTGSDMRYATFKKASMENMKLEDCFLSNSDFKGAHMAGTSFCGSRLYEAKLKDADMTGCDFQGCKMHYREIYWICPADFTGAKLIRANMPDASLEEVFLKKANCTDANLAGLRANDDFYVEHLIMPGAKLNNSSWANSHISDCTFDGADFTDADFQGAKFTRCSFTEANWTGVNLEDAEFVDCDCSGVTMDAVKGVSKSSKQCWETGQAG